MLKKLSAAALLITLLISASVVQAYDLPKIKPDKKVTKPVEQAKGPMLKSDWKSADLFEQKIRERLNSGEPLAPNDPARIAADPNFVFIAFYNDAPYFLDRYSIKIKQNDDGVQVWEQSIFPITKKFSPQNAKATHQKFCLANGKFYNSTKDKDAISALKVEADRTFLEECFKVGYCFAFGREAHGN